MIVACWSVKGGVGTTVVAAGTALSSSERRGWPVLLVDLAGDLPYCLGVADQTGSGVAEWSSTGPMVPADALSRLCRPVAPALELLTRGSGPLAEERADLFVQLLAESGRTVVVDCGRIEDSAFASTVAARAHRSLLVTRLCGLALRRATRAPLRPSGVVVVREPGRAMSARDVENVLHAPVVAELSLDPAVARAVDAGLFVARRPRSFSAAVDAVTGRVA
ncbi:MAG: hypothetical protein KDB02_14790 [Acidimicrobiales bacterium]|nr:hypothetical protein [Acidimicrobiales bacterium]